MSVTKDNRESSLFDRIKREQDHHKTFDYKQKIKLCQECGEKDGRHTYTCIYYDRDK